jgi:hypothetical protein
MQKDQYFCTENVNVITCKYNENTLLQQTNHIKEYGGINPLHEIKGLSQRGLNPQGILY